MNDVDIMRGDEFDPPLEDNAFYVIAPNGNMFACDTEEQACQFQRGWRALNGLHPILGIEYATDANARVLDWSA